MAAGLLPDVDRHPSGQQVGVDEPVVDHDVSRLEGFPARPPVDTATTRSPRRVTVGVAKWQWAGSCGALHSTPSASASANTAALTGRGPTTKTSRAPTRSPRR